jgi:hypothetical protein
MNKIPLLPLLSVCFCLINAQDRIDTIRIYDRADNLLYYLTYDYMAGGVLIGQSLFDRTGYFLKGIAVDGSGKRTFRDDNGDLYHYSIPRTDGAKNYFDLYDRFNKPSEQRVCQGYSSPGATAGMIEFFNLSGGLTHRMQYQYDGTRIQRINILDNAGALSHHADVHYIDDPGVEDGAFPQTGDGLLEMRPGLQGVAISFALKSAGRVRMEAFDIRGRRAGLILDRVFPAGPGSLFCSTRGFAFSRSAGVYLIKTDIKGRLYHGKLVVLD